MQSEPEHTFESPFLVGLDEIGAAFNRTRWTARRWIDHEGFPACRLPDGTWVSDIESARQWLRHRRTGSRYPNPAPTRPVPLEG